MIYMALIHIAIMNLMFSPVVQATECSEYISCDNDARNPLLYDFVETPPTKNFNLAQKSELDELIKQYEVGPYLVQNHKLITFNNAEINKLIKTAEQVRFESNNSVDQKNYSSTYSVALRDRDKFTIETSLALFNGLFINNQTVTAVTDISTNEDNTKDLVISAQGKVNLSDVFISYVFRSDKLTQISVSASSSYRTHKLETFNETHLLIETKRINH